TATRWFRLIIITIALGLWFLTQSLIGARELPAGQAAAGELLSDGDGLFAVTAGLHRALEANPGMADALLIASSLGIDLLALFLIVATIFGSTIRPFLALIILFMLRQICQGLSPLPAPAGMIWHDPGFPSLLVTYGVANDFFFSGHTAIATLGAIEVGRLGGRWWIVGTLLALFEMATVIALRAHYTMDVYAGAITALLVATLAVTLAPRVDALIAREGDTVR
ncbi:MAG TPA: hypothetical protein EYN79_11000, partial [Planctomycetes bacterium]|nr:hypothetical protein [Planctomycetota bacterium]